jgi:hypothetical protein
MGIAVQKFSMGDVYTVVDGSGLLRIYNTSLHHEIICIE